MTLRQRPLLGMLFTPVALMAVWMGLSALGGLWWLGQTDRQLHAQHVTHLDTQVVLARTLHEVLELEQTAQTQAPHARDPGYREALSGRLLSQAAQVESRLATVLVQPWYDSDLQQRSAALQQDFQRHRQAVRQLTQAMSEPGQSPERLAEPLRVLSDHFFTLNRHAQDWAIALARQEQQHQDQAHVQLAQRMKWLVAIGALFSAIWLGVWYGLARRLSAHANTLVHAMIDLAHNGTAPPESVTLLAQDTRDPLAELARAMCALHVAAQTHQATQQALEKAHYLTQAIVRNNPDPIWIKDKDGCYITCNPRFEGFTGRPLPDMVGLTDYEIFTREQADFFRFHDRRAIDSGGRPCSNEEWLQFTDGHRELLHVIKTALYDAQGGLIGVMGVGRDITQLRTAEKSAREREETLRAILSQASDGIVLAEWPQGRLVQFNDAACRLLGRPREQMASLGLNDVPGLWPTHQGPVFQETGEEHRRIQRLDGSWVDVLSTMRPLRLHDTDYVVAFWRDETETRRTALALERRERIFRTIVNQSPLAVMLLDAHSLAFEELNDATCHDLGYSRDELLHMSVYDIQSSWGREQVQNIALRAQTIGFMEFENRHRRKDGTERDFWITARALLLDERSYLSVVWMDITERKASERELLRYQTHLRDLVAERTAALAAAKDEAEAANRAKTMFIANMSHEIRTPMNAIIGMAHLLADAELPPRQRDHLGKLQGAAQHLLSILNDLLDFSKIEAGRIRVESQTFELHQLVAQCCEKLHARLRDKGLWLRQNLPPAPTWLRGDGAKISQILLNYLSNATKFTDRGGITIQCRFLPIEPAEWPGHTGLRLEVHDTGMGLKALDLSRLFLPFEQADGSITRRYGGTGLGLALAKRLADVMKGQVGAQDRPDGGALFWLEVPLTWASAPAGTPAILAPASPDDEDPLRTLTRQLTPHAGQRVLLVEDDPISREVTAEWLHMAGLHVELAEDGQQGVEMATNHPPDLILMDMQMPRLGGLEATRALRALLPKASLPILAMTANAFGEDRQACLDAGMNDHLAKPVEPQQLCSALLRWLPSVADSQTAPASIPPPDTASMPVSPPPLVPPPPAAAPSNALTVLEAAGIDTQDGLHRFAQRTASYLRVLDHFAQHHATDAQLLARQIERVEYANARQVAHALQGAAGNLGMRAVQQPAQTLERMLIACLNVDGTGTLPALSEPLGRLTQALQTACHAIEQLRPPVAQPVSTASPPPQPTAPAPVQTPPSPPVAPPSLTWLQDQLDTLRAWLEADSLDAATLWNQLLPTIQAWRATRTEVPAEAVDAITRHISRFDHELALHALADLHAQITASDRMG